MKKFFYHIGVCSVVLAAAACTALPVQAADTPDLTVSIEQKEISITDLKKANYEVPVFVKLEQNVNLNAIEFGINADSRCRFDVVTRNEYSLLYGEMLGIEMSCASVPSTDNFAWLTWASTNIYYQENSNILMLLVKIPESAKADDVYEIHYLTQSPANEAKKHVWYNFGTKTDYVQSGNVLWNDGYIKITEATGGDDEILLGDANLDGTVNILDAIVVNRTVLGKETLEEAQKQAADMNGNDIIDSTDSLMIMKKIVGITE